MMLIFYITILATITTQQTPEAPEHPDDLKYSQDESVLLGKDAASGCLCRKYLYEKYVTCYDPIHCKIFPKTVQFRTQSLRISTTAITTLSMGDLAKNINLTTFRMEGNDYFRTIQPGTFYGMDKLVNLSITHNKNLMELHRDTFNGLINLQSLILNKNGFLALKDFTAALNPRSLPTIKKLTIAHMLFPEVRVDDFEPLHGTTINNLNIHTCKIEYMEPGSLAPFKNLHVLGLGENNLRPSNIIDLINQFANVSLCQLSLYNMGFKELPINLLKTIGGTNITHLNLSMNRFEVIQAFPFMPNVQRIDLTSVIALNISKDAFRLLPQLKSLNLDKNQFSDVPEAVLLAELTHLDISYSSEYFTPQDLVFKSMRKLEYLNLSGNNIRKLSNNSFVGLQHLKVLGLRKSSLFFIENESFLSLGELIFLDLYENPFPTRMLNGSIFDGLTNLEVLLLGNCQIERIDYSMHLFTNLANLKHLGLENNLLKTFDKTIFQDLVNLESLDISGNHFVTWNEQLFVSNRNLWKLVANDNKIRNISEAMIEDFLQLRYLNLQRNQFSCTCPDMSALQSILYRKKYLDVINMLHQRQLNCTYPENCTEDTILDYLNFINETDSCKINYTSISLLIAIPIILFIASAVIYIYYRCDIHYYLFICKMHVDKKCRRYFSNTDEDTSLDLYEYDAFVSYCNEDRKFIEKLIDTLENNEPHFKLCVYERDFQIGTMITESVMESITKSKKILLIVSQAYVKSQWCRWEVQVTARYRPVIMIKFGELSTENLNPLLKYMLRTRIYLEWSAQNSHTFWNKLKQALIVRDKIDNEF